MTSRTRKASTHVSVRTATSADLPAVLRMDGRASSDDAERSAYLAECLRSEHCLVACGPGATDEHGVIGLTVLRQGHFFSRDFIDYLWVQAEHRREGIGSTLLQACVAEATSTRVFTSTNQSNRPMQELLAARGWLFSGRLQGLNERDPELVYFLDPAPR